jgi:hypothetical protein
MPILGVFTGVCKDKFVKKIIVKEGMKLFIYKTTNRINGKIYIGLHTTYNIDDGYIGSGKWLKKAIKKYGVENFDREILEECENIEDLLNKEVFWIRKLGATNNKIGYNISKGGEFTPAGKNNILSKIIYVYDMNNDYIENIYYGARETASYIFSNCNKYSLVKRIIKRDKGFYKNLYFSIIKKTKEEIIIEKENRKKEISYSRAISQGRKSNIVAINPDGKVFDKICNVSEFSKKNKLDRKSIESCLSGKYKSHKGWIFYYEGKSPDKIEKSIRHKKFIGCSPNGEKIEFYSKSETTKYGLNPIWVSSCLSGKQKTHNKWTFNYAE